MASDPWGSMRQPMPNPEDPWEGLRSTGPAPNAFAMAAQAGGAMPVMQEQAIPVAPPRQFNRLLDPKRGGIFGLLGRLADQPTLEESQMDAIGASRAKATSFMTQQMQGGVPVQQAFMNFVNTPDGMQFFQTDPDPQTFMAEFMKNTAAPAAEKGQVVAPGSALVGEQTGNVMFQNPVAPTDEQRNFEFFTGVAQMEDKDRMELAKAVATKLATGDVSDLVAAAKRRVEAGDWTQKQADMLISGAVEVIPTKGSFGEPNGVMLIDKTNPNAQPVFIPNTVQQGPKDGSGKPSAAEQAAAQEPGQVGTAIAALKEDPADILRGIGIGPIAEKFMGGILGQFIPSMSGEQADARRAALEVIKLDASGLRDSGRVLAADVGILNNIIDLTSATMNPQQGGERMLRYNDLLRRRFVEASKVMVDPSASPKVRGEAAEELVVINRARLNMPTDDEIVAKMAQLKAEEGGAIQSGEKIMQQGEGALKAGEEAADGALAGEKQAPKPDNVGNDAKAGRKQFGSDQELAKAVAAGTVKAGDTVVVNGETFMLKSRKGAK